MPVEHAFEVWYLSCISEECSQSLNNAIKSILEASATDPEIVEILNHWLLFSISVEDAQMRWFTKIQYSSMYPLANMTSKRARVKLARYLLAGVFDHNENYVTGNPTAFLVPPSLQNLA